MNEIGASQKVGVESIHMGVEPVIILEVAVMVFGEGARHVLCKVVQILLTVVDLQLGYRSVAGIKLKVLLVQL